MKQHLQLEQSGMQPAPTVLEHLEQGVLTVTLNRPQRKNAITRDMLLRLNRILLRAASDPAVGAIVLTGAGAAFCAGGDMQAMAGAASIPAPVTASDPAPAADAAPLEQVLAQGAQTAMLLHRMPKPTIAMVNGVAAGGGLALAAACDIRIGGEAARFTFAYPNIGLSGDFGASYLMEKLLGATRAREFCLLAPLLDATEALRIGLLTRVCADAGLTEQTRQMALTMARGATFALGCIKENLNAASELSADQAIAIESANFARCRASEGHRRAVLAFAVKAKS